MRSPAPTLRYACALVAGRESRHVGHNPLGAWMIVALLLSIAAAGFSGWLYTTDRYWGVEWVEDLHDGLATTVLVLVGLHVAGVLFSSWRQRENLVAAMFHGNKRAPQGNDVV